MRTPRRSQARTISRWSASWIGRRPTFHHPNLSAREIQFLLAAAYARFYLRPSFFANLWRFERQWLRGLVERLDLKVSEIHSRKELQVMSRAVEC